MQAQGCLKIPPECIPDVCSLSDLKGVFIGTNGIAEELTGYKREELIGKSFLELNLLSPQQIPRANALLAKNALGEDTGREEFVFNRKGGGQVTLELSAHPVKIQQHRERNACAA